MALKEHNGIALYQSEECKRYWPPEINSLEVNNDKTTQANNFNSLSTSVHWWELNSSLKPSVNYTERNKQAGVFSTCYFMHVAYWLEILMWWEFISMLSFVKQPTINKKYLTSWNVLFCATNARISNDLMVDVFLVVHKPILLKLQSSVLKVISDHSSFGIKSHTFWGKQLADDFTFYSLLYQVT